MEQNIERAIAQGQALAYLMMSKEPVAVQIETVANRLGMETHALSQALRDLEENGKIKLTITKASVTLIRAEPETEVRQEQEQTQTPEQTNPETASTKGGKPK